MVSKIIPQKNEVIFITKNAMLHVLRGSGGIEVDFKVFHNWQDKLIFLDKGQYIKFLSDDFIIRKIDFEDDTIYQNQEFRVLFKHLVSLGYIHFDECSDCKRYLDSAILSNPAQLLDISTQQWFWQNPFGAHPEEYHVIFDVKDVIDQQFKNQMGISEIVELLNDHNLNPQKVYKEKVGITIKALQSKKVLSEAQKEVAFSNKSMKEIAYEYGFNDPAYFNRFFKQNTGHSPGDFRETQNLNPKDHFADQLYELISLHHQQQHQIGFYAEEMNLSIKALSKKTKERLNITLGQLIRLELIKSAKKHLREGVSIRDIARLLHFEEPNHFSTFFKHYTGENPGTYLHKKVQ